MRAGGGAQTGGLCQIYRVRLMLVLVTVPADRADELARRWVGERWAACANLLEARSVFRWNGEVQVERETLVVLKTPAERLDALRREVQRSHPYDVPEIVAIAADEVNGPYGEWVQAEVGGLA